MCLPPSSLSSQIDMATGDKYYQKIKLENGRMRPGDWASNGVKQRAHTVTEKDGGLFVELSMQPARYAKPAFFGMCMI